LLCINNRHFVRLKLFSLLYDIRLSTSGGGITIRLWRIAQHRYRFTSNEDWWLDTPLPFVVLSYFLYIQKRTGQPRDKLYIMWPISRNPTTISNRISLGTIFTRPPRRRLPQAGNRGIYNNNLINNIIVSAWQQTADMFWFCNVAQYCRSSTVQLNGRHMTSRQKNHGQWALIQLFKLQVLRSIYSPGVNDLLCSLTLSIPTPENSYSFGNNY
jgi:hypothetical protein